MLFRQVTERLLENMRRTDKSEKTITIYKNDLKTIQQYLEKRHNGQVYIEDVSVQDLEAFLLYTKDVLNRAPNSRSRYLYTLRAFYSFAYKKEIVVRNIALSIDLINMPKKERQYLSSEKVELLLEAIDNRLIKLVATFLFNTGLRISECLNLTLEDVDLDNNIISVRGGKGNKDRFVPINDQLHVLLMEYVNTWRDAPDSERFFATRKTGSLSQAHLNRTINDAAKVVGIKHNVSCHILRHSFASTLVKNNVGLVQIQKLLGHSNLAITSIYTHTNMEQLTDAVNALHISGTVTH